MKNLDTLQAKKAEIMQKLNDAVKNGDEAAFAQAFTQFSECLQEAVMAEARGLISATDNAVLTGRGVRALTSEETNYYNAVIDAMRSSNPKQALSDIDVVFPKTVIDAVFEDLVEEHPLLNYLDFQNTSGLIEYFINVNEDGAQLATWSALTAEIIKELTGGFEKIDLAHKKLSAFLPVAKAMLDLGPAWLDRYTRTVLGEALFNGLEDGIISGDGLLEPIGMIRDLSAPVDPVTGYEEKTPVAVTDFLPENYGALVAQLITGPTGLIRTVKDVILIVNPVDYLTKVMPATVYQRQDGTYARDVFPFPTTVIQSARLTAGKAILGLPKRYFMGLGTAKGGKLEYSDEYRFLEDERVYLIKLYGTGRPKDNVSFLVLDISGLQAMITRAQVTNLDDIVVPAYPDARLASLTIGSLDLTPAFNKSVFVYTAATTNATNIITAVAKDGEATVEIEVNGASHTNGTAATWEEGENTVEITVTKDGESETYSVTVTKTTE